MITPNEVEDVLHYFYNNHDNRSGVIAKNLNIKLRSVNYIIDLHLSKKRNYMGVKPNYNKFEKHIGKKVVVYDENNNLIGNYKTLIDCANKLGVNEGCISKFIRGYHSGGHVNHNNGNKYTYILC